MSNLITLGSGRISLSIALVFIVVLLSGCCTLVDLDKCCADRVARASSVQPDDCVCNMDIVFAFDTPESDEECQAKAPNTIFVSPDTQLGQNWGLGELDGGGGVVDRDGGGGVVDRDGEPVEAFCLEQCPGDAYDLSEIPWMLVTKSNDAGVLIARTICGAPGSGP
jgi:uncharacterized protein YceK